MKSIWGLLVALVGLVVIFLWATGRAKNAWDAIVGDTAGNNAQTPTVQSPVQPSNTPPTSTVRSLPDVTSLPPVQYASLDTTTPYTLSTLANLPSISDFSFNPIALPPTYVNIPPIEIGGTSGNSTTPPFQISTSPIPLSALLALFGNKQPANAAGTNIGNGASSGLGSGLNSVVTYA